ncbi:MAG: hypothetical protein M3461_02035 [Pseudomonadota bacterium]|nr:hypothetical protein [Pseudomonadota bacterium]
MRDLPRAGIAQDDDCTALAPLDVLKRTYQWNVRPTFCSQFRFGVTGIGEDAVAATAQVNDSLQRYVQLLEIDGDTQLGLETGEEDAPVQRFHRLASG